MKIKVINPNTTVSMTQKIGEAAQAVAAATTEILPCTPSMGPVSIEGHYDEAISVLGVLEAVRQGEQEGCDGYVIACFGDPGLLAAREVAHGPVIGVAEAAMRAASFLCTGFSVVTTLSRTRSITWHLVTQYGMDRHCRNVRATDLAVLDLEDPASNARQIIAAECRRALTEDRSDAIVLGCAGMADLAASLQDELGVPVIDGVRAAVTFVESLVRLQLTTSKSGDLAFPRSKAYNGMVQSFAPVDGSPRRT
jgi:allantoin racemase